MGALTMNVRSATLLLSLLVGTWVAASCGDAATTSPTTTPTNPPTTPIGEAAVQVVANGCREAVGQRARPMGGDGKAATVAHVVAGASSVEVRGPHGSGPATVVYFDPVLDVAVVEVDAERATALLLGAPAA